MIKMIVFVTKRPDLDRGEFLRIWQEEHADLVWRLPGLRRYVQNPAVQSGQNWPYDGVAELSFDSKADLAKAFDTQEGAELRAHEPSFVDRVEWLLTEERVVEPPAVPTTDIHHNEKDQP